MPKVTLEQLKKNFTQAQLGEALYHAVCYDREDGTPPDADFVKTLIDAGAPLESVHGRFSFTPLMAAAQQGNVNISRLLIEAGANVNARAIGGLTPLMIVVRAVVDTDIGAIGTGGNDEAMIRLLHKHGADIKAKSAGNRTVLMHAAGSKCKSTAVETLLSLKASPSPRDARGLSARDLALKADKTDIATLLEKALENEEAAKKLHAIGAPAATKPLPRLKIKPRRP